MKLQVLRYSNKEDEQKSTYGFLMDVTEGRKFLCHTLEDPYQPHKIYGNTRIPEGKYKIELRMEGGMHKKYTARYHSMHKGMLWIKEVPNFEYIYIHIGNTPMDTKGCLLVGNRPSLFYHQCNFLGESASAYKTIYPDIANAILSFEDVTIEYINLGLIL